MDKSLMLNEIKKHYNFKNNRELANHLGVKPNVISNWKSRNTFDVELIYTKCEDINPHWLLTGEPPIVKTSAKSINITGKDLRDQLKEAIEKIKEVHGISQKDIAESAGDSAPNLSNYLSGKKDVNKSFLVRLKDAFNITFVEDPLTKENLAERLKRYREENDLFQEELAMLLGITQRSYATYEKGEDHPTDEIFDRIKRFISAPYIHRRDVEGIKHRIQGLVDEFADGSMKKFAELVGLDYDAVRKYINEKRFPSHGYNNPIKKICQTFGINEYWLLTGFGIREVALDEPKVDSNSLIKSLRSEIRNLKEKNKALKESNKYLEINNSSLRDAISAMKNFSETGNQQSKKISTDQSETEQEESARTTQKVSGD